MKTNDIATRVGLILRQARGVVPIKIGGNPTFLRSAADVRVDAAEVVRESRERGEAVSEQLDLLRVVYSALAKDQQLTFWNELHASLKSDTASVIAHALVELGRLDRIDILATSLPMADGAALEQLWHGLRSKLCLQPTMFADTDLDALLSAANVTLRERVFPKRHKQGMPSALWRLEKEIIATCASVDRIQYLRLKHQLLSAENPELNTDKKELISRAQLLGFSTDIANALDEVERQLRAASTPIDFKSCMDLLRSVFEKIAQESVARVEQKIGVTAPRPGQKGISSFAPFKEYLVNAKLLSADESEVIQKLYNYMSNAGAHSLSAAPEQARVTKNTVIEWSLMILGRVQQFV